MSNSWGISYGISWDNSWGSLSLPIHSISQSLIFNQLVINHPTILPSTRLYTYFLYGQRPHDDSFLSYYYFIEEQPTLSLAQARQLELTSPSGNAPFQDIIIKEKHLALNPIPPPVGTNMHDAEGAINLIDIRLDQLESDR